MAAVSAPAFWQELYDQGRDGWDLGGAHPSLAHLVDTTPPRPGRVAVPGCGRGHDALYLARRGYDVVGFDFADTAIREARARARAAGVQAAFEQRDLFTLTRDYERAFDGVWEHTCFCAIDPRRRGEYVETIVRILRPGGWFLACFFPMRSYGSGPPFPIARGEVRGLLATRFRIERAFAPPRPVGRRAGQEWLVLATRTGAPS